MHELSLAQAQAQGQRTFHRERELVDFSWQVTKKAVEPGRVEGVVSFAIPFSSIWLKVEEGVFKTQLEVQLELRDGEGLLCWEYKDTYEIAIKEAELKEKQKASFSRDISFVLEDNLEKLRRGKNTLHIRLRNLTGNEELKKVMEIEF
jgi:hypothetical protein